MYCFGYCRKPSFSGSSTVPEPVTKIHDVAEKTLSELHEIIVSLKIKHYRDGLSTVEHDELKMTKHLYRGRVRTVP